jgi:molybdopterin converting factor small subunit
MRCNLEIAFLLLFTSVAIAFAARFIGRKQQLILETTTTTVSELREGYFQIKGRVRGSAPTLLSPMSNLPCVYYEFLVKQRVHVRVKGESTLKTVVKDIQGVPCMVEDGTGSAAVELMAADMELYQDHQDSSKTFKSPSSAMREMLKQRYQFSTKGAFLNKELFYEETILEEGDEVYVLGQVETAPDGPRFVKGGPAFIVSDFKKEQLGQRYARQANFLRVIAVAVAIVAFLFIYVVITQGI